MLPDAGAVPRTHVDGPPNLKLFPRDEVGPKAVDQKSTPLGQTQGTERRVLVDSKWLREGKRSDACGPAPMRGCVVQKESSTTPVPSDFILNNIAKGINLKLKFEQLLSSNECDDVKRTEKKQIPLEPTDSEDVSLDAKELIRAIINESGETENSIYFDPRDGVDDRIINKILASHPVSLLDSQESALGKTKP